MTLLPYLAAWCIASYFAGTAMGRAISSNPVMARRKR